MAVIEGAIANIALPTIARDINTSPSASIRVINAHKLAVTLCLLPIASIREIRGYRKVYQVASAIAAAAAVRCLRLVRVE